MQVVIDINFFYEGKILSIVKYRSTGNIQVKGRVESEIPIIFEWENIFLYKTYLYKKFRKTLGPSDHKWLNQHKINILILENFQMRCWVDREWLIEFLLENYLIAISKISLYHFKKTLKWKKTIFKYLPSLPPVFLFVYSYSILEEWSRCAAR